MITKKTKGGRLLEIDNLHVPDSGLAPSIDATDKYIGYFENPYGEQWVFVGDRKAGKAVIRGGDVGWESEHEISVDSPCPDMILNEPEKHWIVACFMAMSGLSLTEIVAKYNKAAEEIAAEAQRRLYDQNGSPA